ncbi:hypothetical protein WY02_03535 [Pseudonocardia sp. AL041005-10]|jgi:hypothetical protein|nr:hypothetical protein [Pseudonocardia sp. AL041005-10]ALE77674.1 hypothetical protein WY02_03535 [Pseudonocardia sp. AL041005-10]
MPTQSLEALAVNALNKKHIRKGKKIAVLRAEMDVDIPDAITEGGTGTGASAVPISLKALPGFQGMGLIRKDDGVPMSRDQEKSDVMAVGFQDPVRSDFDSDTFTAQIVALQTHRVSIESYLGVDLSNITINPATGELSFPQPTDGAIRQNRWLFLAQDGVGLDRFWWGRCWTAGIVSETDDQNMGGEDAWMWPMTISSETDEQAGYSIHHYFGGPGWKAALESMGFGALTG